MQIYDYFKNRKMLIEWNAPSGGGEWLSGSHLVLTLDPK